MKRFTQKKRKELRERVDELSKQLGGRSPEEQMIYYSQGIDPCPHPQMLDTLIRQCHNRRIDGQPTANDWAMLMEYWESHPELHGGIVDADTRFNAAAVILPYCYPKLKSVEVTGELEHNIRVVPLTGEDIDRIKGRLKDEY